MLPYTAYSKRMYGKNSTIRRCQDCVARLQADERANATARQAQVRAGADGCALFNCAGCSIELPPSAFSRSQLLQKGEARRCTACLSAVAHGRTLLDLGPDVDQHAVPAALAANAVLRLDVEISRLKAPLPQLPVYLRIPKVGPFEKYSLRILAM